MDKYEKIGNSILDNITPESSKIEYKTSHLQKESIMRSICAMLNDYSDNSESYIFIGVIERKDDEKSLPVIPIVGTDLTAEAIEKDFLTSVFKGISPHCSKNVIFSDAKYQNVHYVLITVRSFHNNIYRVVEVDNETKRKINQYPRCGVYIRENRDSVWVSDYDYRVIQIAERNNGYNFSRAINETATVDDLRYEHIREYLRVVSPESELLKQEKEQVCKDLKLITPEKVGGVYKVYNFALLMFGDNPQKFFPSAYIRIISEVEGTYNMEEAPPITGVLWRQAQDVEEYLRRNVIRTYTLRTEDSFQHKDVTNYPLRALRELVFNSIVHKDYSKNQPIEIQIFGDYIYITNPNRPLPPVSVSDLMNKTHFPSRNYLNPDIMAMFHSLKLVETYGSGIRIAKNELKLNGSPELKYDLQGDDNNTTTVYVFINEEYKKIKTNVNTVTSKQKSDFEQEKSDFEQEKSDFELIVLAISNINMPTVENIMALFSAVKFEKDFGVSDIMLYSNIKKSNANTLKNIMLNNNLIIKVNGKGRYKFNHNILNKKE